MTLLDGARLWSVDELQRELANALAVIDALTRMQRAGLIHQLGEFVFITRTAQRSLNLTGI